MEDVFVFLCCKFSIAHVLLFVNTFSIFFKYFLFFSFFAKLSDFWNFISGSESVLAKQVSIFARLPDQHRTSHLPGSQTSTGQLICPAPRPAQDSSFIRLPSQKRTVFYPTFKPRQAALFLKLRYCRSVIKSSLDIGAVKQKSTSPMAFMAACFMVIPPN